MPEPRFLVDADMPRSVAHALVKVGFDVADVRDIGLGAASDPEIMARADSEGRIVVTRDKGFGEVLRYPNHPGAIILRLPNTYTAGRITERLETFLSEVPHEALHHALIIVEVDRFRRRPLA